jgi:hypothetical protein
MLRRLTVFAFALVSIFASQAESEDIDGLNQRVLALDHAGRYVEALPVAQKALELTRLQAGEDHPATATSLTVLAALYFKQGRVREGHKGPSSCG